jgi:chaperonin cofactor prefoldin
MPAFREVQSSHVKAIWLSSLLSVCSPPPLGRTATKQIGRSRAAPPLAPRMSGPQLVHLEMDEKDKESLQELQQGMAQAAQEKQMLQAKLQMRDSERRRSDLTLHELADLPDTARAYKQVGKMFLMHSLPDLVQSLTDKSANCEKEVGALKEKLTHVVEAEKKVEADFNDFVKSHMVETPS